MYKTSAFCRNKSPFLPNKNTSFFGGQISTYDEQNRLTQSVTGGATTYYGYDNNGNQISEWTRITGSPVVSHGVKLSESNEETDDLLTLYEYDVFDRLVKIEQGEDIIENAYTADGKKFS